MSDQNANRQEAKSEIKPKVNPAAQPTGFSDESEPTWAPPEHLPEQTSAEPVMKPADTTLPNTPSPT